MDSIFSKLLANDVLPRFAKIGYHIEEGSITDIDQAIREAVKSRLLTMRIERGARIAITAGSREINHMPDIFRSIVAVVKEAGGDPFLVPAMGSHGGATAEGQYELLRGYGITEEYVGCPIKSSMETVEIGTSPSGLPVHIDKNASKADGIILVGRIKPHTDFRGKVESGLMKMMAIGLGKQYGAMTCHKRGIENMAKNVWEFGSTILEKVNILFGVYIIEDFYHNTYKVGAIPAERIPEEEPELLIEAKRLIPGIPFDKVDTLFVQEIGKDISGAGMDPNVTGRSGNLGIWKPNAQVIVVQDITEKSHFNGAGLGLADVTTQRAFTKFNFEMTYPNGITSCDVFGMKIPPVKIGRAHV